MQLLKVIKHYSNCEVEYEIRAYDDAEGEVKACNPKTIRVLDHVHDNGPSFKGGALEDGQEGCSDVIEVCNSPV
jgi:hypothetical protein